MKKYLAGLFAAFLVFFGSYQFSNAETVTDGKMYETFKEHTSNEHYDFKEGSFKLTNVKTYNLSEPLTVKQGEKKVKINQVKAAVAKFKTVRDYIFFKNYSEHVYFAPNQEMTLKEADLKKHEQMKGHVQEFKNAHPVNISLSYGPIIGVMALIIIVPLIFLFIWHKYKYSTMRFKRENNLAGDHSGKR
ncbi:hypothetical protein [Tuberibacillus sp. Marseille-P3662]|uniref:hypothetical protein n=1 Tax=Tuberibacillus sp. Marseille-P3662 TaxID=1965358 RepID=UPI000A1C8681|nr:hypothetical protein [Tuberibacillus sp. Marseille-P3662]